LVTICDKILHSMSRKCKLTEKGAAYKELTSKQQSSKKKERRKGKKRAVETEDSSESSSSEEDPPQKQQCQPSIEEICKSTDDEPEVVEVDDEDNGDELTDSESQECANEGEPHSKVSTTYSWRRM
jgi:hypothetical protein